jgi:hypothetical protein
MGLLRSRLARGLARPESREDTEDASTIAGMRRAIEKSARSSQLIAECLKEAEKDQLSREEIYVLLAYRALVELEDKHGLLERLKTRLVEYAITNDPDGHF